jgi:hypothetical protein
MASGRKGQSATHRWLKARRLHRIEVFIREEATQCGRQYGCGDEICRVVLRRQAACTQLLRALLMLLLLRDCGGHERCHRTRHRLVLREARAAHVWLLSWRPAIGGPILLLMEARGRAADKGHALGDCGRAQRKPHCAPRSRCQGRALSV